MRTTIKVMMMMMIDNNDDHDALRGADDDYDEEGEDGDVDENRDEDYDDYCLLSSVLVVTKELSNCRRPSSQELPLHNCTAKGCACSAAATNLWQATPATNACLLTFGPQIMTVATVRSTGTPYSTCHCLLAVLAEKLPLWAATAFVYYSITIAARARVRA